MVASQIGEWLDIEAPLTSTGWFKRASDLCWNVYVNEGNESSK
ncbi:hypothetical protein PC128_g6723 [Phytophthora cactorum]|nr:hypothetical protein PC128_g6723 [Phytophthora cactorum]